MKAKSHIDKVLTTHGQSSRWANWGDYGDILVHGMTGHLSRRGGLLQLERAGPFTPPITFPNCDVVLTQRAKTVLRKRLLELKFRKVVSARIVRLDWHLWNTNLDDPPIFPKIGEPEHYILEKRDSPKLAEEMGQFWELVPKIDPEIQVRGKLNLARYSGEHFVRATLFAGYNFVSSTLGRTIKEIASEWVSFEPTKI
jgi:hypothetical protein